MSNRKVIAHPKLNSVKPVIKVKAFETVSFYDDTQKRQVIVLYTLGEDGILREFTGGKWNAFPITE